MPGIETTLANHDLDFLNRTARIWKAEISQRDVSSAREDLLHLMLQPANLHEVIRQLPEAAQKAWQELVSKGGRISWAIFSRKYGDIRDFGPARREREQPDKNPGSVSESLWYSGLIGKAFLKVAGELAEMVYIPDELFNLVTPKVTDADRPAIRPAVNQKPRGIHPADSSILDHLTDVLAAARMARRLPPDVYTVWGIPQTFLASLLASVGLTDESGQPVPESLKAYFQQDRSASLLMLFQAWVESKEINELRMLPGLVFEGAWTNDPLTPRKVLLELLSSLPTETWWSISSLLSMVKNQAPDFQRPAGDYDSWFIREENGENYLRGYEHWNEIDGRLLYFILTGPLHWLGLVNLAGGDSGGKFTAFQLNPNALAMMRGDLPVVECDEEREVEFKDNTALVIPINASREMRYQVGRFCEFSKAVKDESWYRITPTSLEAASKQGLHIHQLIQLLERFRSRPLPASLKNLAQRWEDHGLEANIQTGVLLRFSTEAACSHFLRDPKSARLIAETLNPTTLLIHEESREGAIRLLAEMGILAQVEADV